MAAAGRKPVRIAGIAWAPALLLGLLLAADPASAADMDDSFGKDGAPEVTLAVPVIPAIVDGSGRLLPAMRLWFSYLADKAAIHLKIQPANFDRRTADMARSVDHCVLGYARLPSREASARWLSLVRRDRMVFIARQDDPFQGDLPDLLKIASGRVAAPSGVYRETLVERGIDYVAIDDQRSLARMVDAGRVRFGMVIAGTLNAPEVQAMRLRVVAEMPPLEFWFACSPDMPDSLAEPLQRALQTPSSEALRRTALDNVPAEATTPTQ